jgi:hypothetical protein
MMLNKLGNLLAPILGLALLVYSATRSLDFISLTLPANKQILAWFGLAALDGGIVAWLLAFLYGSGSGWQRAIAFLMVVVDFFGAVAIFTLDTIYNAGSSGLVASMAPETIQTAILALSLVIAINIGATIAHQMLDPEALQRQAEEEARAQIEDQALTLIRQNARQLASQVAPQVAGAWREGIVSEYGHRLKRERAPAKLLASGDEELPVNTGKITGNFQELTGNEERELPVNPTRRRKK